MRRRGGRVEALGLPKLVVRDRRKNTVRERHLGRRYAHAAAENMRIEL